VRPYFFYPGVQEVAFEVKCPIHGPRFEPWSEWRFRPEFLNEEHQMLEREYEVGGMWPRDTEQYRNAWNASFRDGRWPAKEIELEGGTWQLPYAPDGRLLDWHNASSLPPWKRVQTHTLEDHQLADAVKTQPATCKEKERNRDQEARMLLEEFGCAS
jgi:hypothetical protein